MTDRRGFAGLEHAAGVTLPQIAAARHRTEVGLGERRERFTSLTIDHDATVVLTGSWGRREVTSESDHDSMILFERAGPIDGSPSIESVAEQLGGKPPGREELFGVQVSLQDLRGKIGRDEDNNANLTRRMLFILESVPVCGADVHAASRRALLAGYLSANVKDYRPPRFLLNDLIRYWRTIAVDFESKMRARRGEGWGLRNAKLRLSRKSLFAGGLIPILECYRHPADAMLDYLDNRMSAPPLDRLADAFRDHDLVDAGARTLLAYDEFLGILNDSKKRSALDGLELADSTQSALFARIAELGEEFESGLLTLLFDDPELHRWVREYLIF